MKSAEQILEFIDRLLDKHQNAKWSVNKDQLLFDNYDALNIKLVELWRVKKFILSE